MSDFFLVTFCLKLYLYSFTCVVYLYGIYNTLGGIEVVKFATSIVCRIGPSDLRVIDMVVSK